MERTESLSLPATYSFQALFKNLTRDIHYIFRRPTLWPQQNCKKCNKEQQISDINWMQKLYLEEVPFLL